MGLAKHFGLVYGAPPPPEPLEFDLGPDDILLIETDKILSDAMCERLKKHFKDVLDKPGRTTIVLSEGLRAKVIHRKVMP